MKKRALRVSWSSSFLSTLLDVVRQAAHNPGCQIGVALLFILTITVVDAHAQAPPIKPIEDLINKGKTLTGLLDSAWGYFYNDLRYRLAAFALVPAIGGLMSRDGDNRWRLFLTALAIGLVAVIPNILGLIKQWAG